MTNRYDVFRDQIADSNDRFQAAMVQAIHAHTATVASVGELLRTVEEHEAQLEESISQLQGLILQQGETLRQQGDELRALRDRLNGA
jgi:hypothetical protein